MIIDKLVKAQAPSACELILPFALYTQVWRMSSEKQMWSIL